MTSTDNTDDLVIVKTVTYHAWCPLCGWESDLVRHLRWAEIAADAHECIDTTTEGA